MSLCGSVVVNAARFVDRDRSYMSAFLRSRLACCADLPAVGNDRGVRWHGHGSAFAMASQMLLLAGFMGPKSGLLARSDILTSGGGGAVILGLKCLLCLSFRNGYGMLYPCGCSHFV